MAANRTSNKRIEAIASELVASRSLQGGHGVALLMGAGCSLTSDVPLWGNLAEHVLRQLGVQTETDDSVNALETYIEQNPNSRDLVEALVKQTLDVAHPSRGYSYLAHLVSSGFYKTIITTNWDHLLEESLAMALPANRLVVLTRDLVPDDRMSDVLDRSDDRVVVVKLHGDPIVSLRMGEGVSTRSLPPRLIDSLAKRMKRTHVVGQSVSDLDIVQLLMARVTDGDLLLVSPRSTAISGVPKSIFQSTAGGTATLAAHGQTVDSKEADLRAVNIGEFDHFFCQLSLAIEKHLIATDKTRKQRLATVEQDILRKEDFGISHISASHLGRLARSLMSRMAIDGSPNIVFFINDPAAPGGMELKKLVEQDLYKSHIEVATLDIFGEPGLRSFKRSYRGTEIPGEDIVSQDGGVGLRIHVLDAITFSGNTLKIAKEQLKQWYPNADVVAGAVFVSQMLNERLESEESISYAQITDRYEIFFPWGVTQTTSDIVRTFKSVDEERRVEINRRPWGAIEVLVSEENCSVRLLTIEAGKRLSFQRHLCRDELFVALDDNIGLDLCAGDLDGELSIFQPSVRSMVLEKGDYALVSRGIWHRTKASMDRARLLEIGFGVYDQRYDIERRFDDYDRLSVDGAK